ncbi:Woronin body major protein [Madurella mycetomatis]|uniref:Woronin body major protein n=1 Tax=Madurella mycetomatis TaxID=100816 RepID=A0A175VPL2_9PEZI|nr:Woronin body major protein [Madurella mycetomatis]
MPGGARPNASLSQPDGRVNTLLSKPKHIFLHTERVASEKKRSALLVKRNNTAVPVPAKSTAGESKPILPQSTYAESRFDVDSTHRPHNSVIDAAESEYRSRIQRNYRKEPHVAGTTVDGPTYRPTHKASSVVCESTVDGPSFLPSYKEEVHVTSTTTVDPPVPRLTYHEDVSIAEEIVDTASHASSHTEKSKMGYYGEDGRYHSFREGLHKLANRIAHPEGQDRAEVPEVRENRRLRANSSEVSHPPNTVTIPCHHIRLGDILILQGRPCQVIRISTSAATGQHRYLGVDLFTKQLHEESSFVSNPAPSVVVQTMIGPVFKQYRVLDMQDGNIVAMTETGDVKQNLPVIDQSNLWARLEKAFQSGRGSVRVLVVTDHGREMAVDMKVVHGSRL